MFCGTRQGSLYHTELDISDGKVLFEWRSLDHIGPEGKLSPIFWFTVNSSTSERISLCQY